MCIVKSRVNRSLGLTTKSTYGQTQDTPTTKFKLDDMMKVSSDLNYYQLQPYQFLILNEVVFDFNGN